MFLLPNEIFISNLVTFYHKKQLTWMTSLVVILFLLLLPPCLLVSNEPMSFSHFRQYELLCRGGAGSSATAAHNLSSAASLATPVR